MPDDSGAAIDLHPHSIESRASWVAAGVTLAILSVAYGSTLLIVVGLRAMEINLGVPRSILALAGALTWIGTGLGGIVMGWLADRIGMRNCVLMGAVQRRRRPRPVLDRADLGAVLRPRRADRLLRDGRDLPAAGDLCQPLVRPSARHRGRADLLGPVHRRRGLAGDLRAADRRSRLADHLSGLCRRGAAGRAAARRAVPPPGAGRLRLRRQAGRSRDVARARARPAPQHRAGDHLRGRLLLLRADGDPAGASGGLLRRYRPRRGDRGDDALGAARLRLRRPAVLGRRSPTATAA